jgi:hypothetical protein
LIGGFGPTLFFGELGGDNRNGTHFMSDIDMKSMRYHIMLGARYKLKERIAVKLNLIYGRVYGSDLYSKSNRAGRNATFYSGIFETSGQIELSILKERLGTRFTFRNLNRFKMTNVNTYIFVGIGGLLYYPRPKYALVITNRFDKYHHFCLTLPIGIGFKYGINRRASLGIEFGQRYTTSDYIDGIKDKFSKANDSYYLFNINVTYKLKTTRSGLPKF